MAVCVDCRGGDWRWLCLLGYGILHGSMERLAIASYATPVLSTGASAVLLGLALSLPFWCGALLVAVGSVLNYLVSARK